MNFYMRWIAPFVAAALSGGAIFALHQVLPKDNWIIGLGLFLLALVGGLAAGYWLMELQSRIVRRVIQALETRKGEAS